MKLATLLLLTLPLYGQQQNDNIEVMVYRGATGIVMPQYSIGLPPVDLTWISARDKTGTASYMIFTLNCDGMSSEVKIAPVMQYNVSTVIFPRDRAIICTATVEAVVTSARKVIDTNVK